MQTRYSVLECVPAISPQVTCAPAAQAILNAWQTGDRRRLHGALEGVKRLKRAADCGESERLELLSEIARDLRASEPMLPNTPGGFHNTLLRHLAREEDKRREGTRTAIGNAKPLSKPAPVALQWATARQ